jgi:hypothetical protein
MRSRWDYSRSLTGTGRQILDGSTAWWAGLGFKGEALPPMSPTPTPTPQPAPAPKEGPNFPSTFDLAGGRLQLGPLRRPPLMPSHGGARARVRDAFSKHARLAWWLAVDNPTGKPERCSVRLWTLDPARRFALVSLKNACSHGLAQRRLGTGFSIGLK